MKIKKLIFEIKFSFKKINLKIIKKKKNFFFKSANGKKCVSKDDLDIIEKNGLCVIDCSWNKIEDV